VLAGRSSIEALGPGAPRRGGARVP